MTVEKSADHTTIRGTLYGPWNLAHAIATTDGIPTDRVVLYPHWTEDGPANQSFNIELNPPADHMP